MKNPFVKDLHYRYKLAYDLLPDSIERLLDFGCGPDVLFLNFKEKQNIYTGVTLTKKK